ncbi:MAG: penicillin-binding protein 2 [Gammaproteobacteria bacterium]|nr:penicillin-binding protein 2 [Gammaproteobacteria bacterium]
MSTRNVKSWVWRRQLVLFGFLVLAAGLALRAVQLQIVQHDFLRGEGDARHHRTVSIPAHRGNLLDRNGAPLAVSTPIDSVWAVPADVLEHSVRLAELAQTLSLDELALREKLQRAAAQKKEFAYIQRHIRPDVAEAVDALEIPGVAMLREYRRYYPSGRAAAHVVGFTDIDDRGREGMEMAYEDWLSGKPGVRRVVRDLNGREIEGINTIETAIPGQDLRLSIDKQLQFFADRALTEAVKEHKAESASLVIMDVKSGEVLAMANYPSYNPNSVTERQGGKQRNRSITDVFEPGSTMKPFTIGAALMSGRFKTEDIVYTSPGHYSIGKYEVRDTGDYGWLDLGGIIKKSSNVGVSKVATQLEPVQMWEVFDELGFGRPPGSAFPGEVAGYFNHPTLWHHVEQATLSYGYGISVSALQLVRAYSTIANDGIMPQVSFVRVETPAEGHRVIPSAVARQLHGMLESVVSDEGTGKFARIPGYRVAGKTGTSHRAQGGGYAEDRYVSVFAGFAPVSDPRFAAVVVIHDPSAGEHYGGAVAAPVFSSVMSNALRLQAVEPDNVSGADLRAQLRKGATPVVDEGDRS